MKIIPCPQLVEAIEYNFSKDKILDILKKILCDFVHKKNLTIILGCTHYEFIKNEISFLLKNCEILDGSFGVSKQIIKSYKVVNTQNNKTRITKIFATKKNMDYMKYYLNKLDLDMLNCSFIKI